jgi:hypothetical protein
MDIDLSEIPTIFLIITCLFLSGPIFLIFAVILFYYQMKKITVRCLHWLEQSKRYAG